MATRTAQDAWREAIAEAERTPWPLHFVLAELIAATEHLLGAHGCDTHGHENYRAAAEAGKKIIRGFSEGTDA